MWALYFIAAQVDPRYNYFKVKSRITPGAAYLVCATPTRYYGKMGLYKSACLRSPGGSTCCQKGAVYSLAAHCMHSRTNTWLVTCNITLFPHRVL